MQIIVANTDKILQPYKGTNGIMIPEFIWKNPNNHRIFSLFDKTDIFNFKYRRTTAHYHKRGISPQQYKINKKLKDFFQISSYGVDENGKVFISGVEAKKYPFFGIQFQPEVVPWNRNKSANVINSTEAIRISQKFGNFFIQEARKNPNFLITQKEFKDLGGFDIRSNKIVKRNENHFWFFNAPGVGKKKGQILMDYQTPNKRHNQNDRKNKIKRLTNALKKLNKGAPPTAILPRSKRPSGGRAADNSASTLPPDIKNMVRGKNSATTLPPDNRNMIIGNIQSKNNGVRTTRAKTG